MAQRRPGGREPKPEEEPALRVPRADATRRIEERIELGQRLLDSEVRNDQELTELESEFHSWHDYNETLLVKLFTTLAVRDRYRPVMFSSWSPEPMAHLRAVRRDIEHQQNKLKSILGQLDLYDEMQARAPAEGAAVMDSSNDTTTFVVHGHDGERKLEVAGFIERITGRRPTILHEQANRGRTIIEKFEDHASAAGFAVVLLTGDDVGGVDPDSLQPRARQNVVLELGFFMGASAGGTSSLSTKRASSCPPTCPASSTSPSLTTGGCSSPRR